MDAPSGERLPTDSNDANVPAEHENGQSSKSALSEGGLDTPPETSASSASSGLVIKKRRRRLDNLGFSSPGPAFLSLSTDSEGITTDDDSDARVRRRSRLSNSHSNLTASSSLARNANNAGQNGARTSSASRSNTPQPQEAHLSQRPRRPSLSASSSRLEGSSASGATVTPKPKSIFRNWAPKQDSSSGNAKGKGKELHGRGNDDRSTNGRKGATRRPSVTGSSSNGVHRSTADDQSLSHAGRSNGRDSDKQYVGGSRSYQERERTNGSSASITALSATSQRQSALLDSRRREMDGVYRDHDILVRELFHLRKFVTLIGYDPEIALQDRSDVFERFRMGYDLATLLSGTSGRATRRVVNAKRGDLSLPEAKASKVASPSSSSAKQRNGAQNDDTESAQDVRAKATRQAEKAQRRHSSLAKNGANGAEGSRSSADEPAEEAPPKRKRGRPRKIVRELSPGQSNADTSEDEDERPEKGRRKTEKRASKIRRNHLLDMALELRRPVEVELIDGAPRLRVLNPANLPLPPTFGHSLSSYLSSWHTTGEFQGANGELEVVSPHELQALEQRQAQDYIRIDELRSQGLLQDRDEALRTSHHNRVSEAPRKQTAWDTILAQIASRAAQQRAEVRTRHALARRTSRMVQTYWDEKLGRGEKHRKAEERRVRALAKWTVREVRKQWKLAVNVVRAQRNAREKQERDRVGREQLKSILEQSSQRLSEQHKALLEAEARASDSESVASSSDNDEEESSLDSDEDDGSSIESESLAMTEDMDESDIDISDDAQDDSSVEEEESGSETEGNLAQLLLPVSPSPEPTTSEPEQVQVVVDNAVKSPILTQPLVEASDVFDATSELRPLQTSRRAPNGTLETKDDMKKENEKAESEEYSAFLTTDTQEVDEDAELERKMWEEDDSDEDEEGSDEDAGLSVEELRKKYGYGQETSVADGPTNDEMEESQQNSGDESESKPASAMQLDGHESSSPKSAVSDDSDDESEHENGLSALVRPQRSQSRTSASTPTVDQPTVKVKAPFLLRGTLRPYQQIGFEWLVNLYNSGSNGILADEMGLGKTIQTIALLGHLACDKGIWGPHLVVAPTSVMLNWEVEFKKFFPGFKILSYYGSQKERKEKRKGWNTENSFNVCITSYQLILADQHILRRKPWQYLVLDEAHHIKNFRSQRWQTLLGFNSQRRLLLTGTPLQNNLMDLWSLMYFLMPNGVANADGVINSGFASMKEFQQWFSNPLDRAVESAGVHTMSEEMDTETKGMVSKLHTLLRPYLLRRLKSEVEREMPAKYEHVIKCRLSKRQQFLYNDFMSRAKTRESLASGNYLSIINCLMQLRKVCNHPDLFEQRPIVTSFAMNRSAVADYEIKELLVRRESLRSEKGLVEGSYAPTRVNLDALHLSMLSTSRRHLAPRITQSLSKLDASGKLPFAGARLDPPGPIHTWTIEEFKNTLAQHRNAQKAAQWQHTGYLNHLRCQAKLPHLFDQDSVDLIERLGPKRKLWPSSAVQGDSRTFMSRCDSVHDMILSYDDRRSSVQDFIDRFAFITPRVVSTDMPRWTLPSLTYDSAPKDLVTPEFDTLHAPAVKLQIAFPDASLLQYDCGKLQELEKLMQNCKYGPHRILIFTQMTKMLDILEIWLNLNGFNYLRLDGSTKVEDRQTLTERFNRDDRIKAFILSTRSGGLGINLTGADMVLFWDLDWNFQIEAQCMDRAHRIGQTRDVHIYRFVSEHTIEENMLKKSQEKRLLDAMVIQDGQFTTEGLGKMSWIESMFDDGSRSIAGVRVGGGTEEDGAQSRLTDKPSTKLNDHRIESAMDAAEDEEDAQAAQLARAEINVMDDEFADEMGTKATADGEGGAEDHAEANEGVEDDVEEEEEEEEEEEGGTVDEYMLRQVDEDWEYFSVV